MNFMLHFNNKGNLENNLEFSFQKFEQEFGFNEHRKKLLASVYSLLVTFRQYGSSEVYIVGSFVSNKAKPGDLDICWNTTGIDYKKCAQEYPEFFTEQGIDTLQQATGIHIAAIFDNYTTDILDWFQFDRDGNKRGWVKIPLFNLEIT